MVFLCPVHLSFVDSEEIFEVIQVVFLAQQGYYFLEVSIGEFSVALEFVKELRQFCAEALERLLIKVEIEVAFIGSLCWLGYRFFFVVVGQCQDGAASNQLETVCRLRSFFSTLEAYWVVIFFQSHLVLLNIRIVNDFDLVGFGDHQVWWLNVAMDLSTLIIEIGAKSFPH